MANNLKELLKLELQNNELKEKLTSLHPHDIARDIKDLESDEKTRLFSLLDNETFGEVVSYLDTENAAEILKELDTNKQVDILDEVSTDDTVDVLQEYEKDERDKLVEKLEDKEDIQDYLKYSEECVGAYITSEYVAVPKGIDVKKAVKLLVKEAPEAETINIIFVVDENGKYEGTITLKSLVKARSPKNVEELIDKYPTLLDLDDVERAALDMKNYNLFAMPVINKENELVGILTVDDVMDITQEEAREDFAMLAAVPATPTKENFVVGGLKRLPWLFILLFLAVPIALLTGSVGVGVMAIGVIALFQPLTLDTPGNIATQTLVVSLKEIKEKNKVSLKEAVKEIISGVLIGIILGIVVFFVSWTMMVIKMPALPDSFSKIPQLEQQTLFSGILGISIFCASSISPIVAIIIPSFCKLIKLDPAVASGPFITTVIDILSTLIYVGVALGLISIAGVML